jgi:hypothetical protein
MKRKDTILRIQKEKPMANTVQPIVPSQRAKTQDTEKFYFQQTQKYKVVQI